MDGREIRQDPLTGEHVILTFVRAKQGPRRESGPDLRQGSDPATCPFCPGNESATHPTIAAIEEDGAWVARAFANRMPLLVVESAPEPFHTGLLGGIGAFGAHEVIVEAPEHAPLHELPEKRTATALELAIQRLRDLRADSRLQTLCWFRNHGPVSGGSQRHAHAQIIGMPMVPERWQRYAGRAQHHIDTTGRPVLEAVLDDEFRDGRRILGTSGPITALCPHASSHPFEVWFVPENPGRSLADATGAEIEGLAQLMPPVLRAVEASVGGTLSYTALALGAAEAVDYRGVGWHLRVLPRLARQGGLERGTGVMVHGVFPEDAAQAIRQAASPALPG